MTIQEVAEVNGCFPLARSAHTYLSTYERLFQAFRTRPVRMLYIGVGSPTHGIVMYAKYFEQGVVDGLDINASIRTSKAKVLAPNFREFYAADARTWHPECDYDLVIDDSSNELCSLLILSNIWPHCRWMYIIEDISYDWFTEMEEFNKVFLRTPQEHCELMDLRHEKNNMPSNNLAVYYRDNPVLCEENGPTI